MRSQAYYMWYCIDKLKYRDTYKPWIVPLEPTKLTSLEFQ